MKHHWKNEYLFKITIKIKKKKKIFKKGILKYKKNKISDKRIFLNKSDT